jgi:predicted DNA-binding protein
MSTTLNFRIKEEQKDQLKLLAEQQGVKISELMRDIIADYLDQYEFTYSGDLLECDEVDDFEEDISNEDYCYDPITGVTTIYVDSSSTCNENYSL